MVTANNNDDDISFEELQQGLPTTNSTTSNQNIQFLLLSHKNTDILTLSTATETQLLPLDFPVIETADICNLKVDSDMVDLLDRKIHKSTEQVVIVVRLLGRGVPGFQHLLDRVRRNDSDQHFYLLVVSGIPASFEPDLTAMCTNVSVEIIHEVLRYFHADGCSKNMANMFRYLADHVLKQGFGYDEPTPQPDHGLYHPKFCSLDTKDRAVATAKHLKDYKSNNNTNNRKPTVAIIFYRCHYLSGNTAFVDAIIDELEALGVNAMGLFTETLRDHQPHDSVNGQAVERFPVALTHLLNDNDTTGQPQVLVDSLISTMAFALGEVNPDGPTLGSWCAAALQAINVPVLQAINSVGTRQEWEESARGLNPLDTAMNVAIPEFDGRIITVPISFMAAQDGSNTVHYYEPVLDRIAAVAKQASRLARLRHIPNRKKKIAFMLTNSSGKAQRIGDAVGLDSPASLMEVFDAMRKAGYDLGDDVPDNGDALIAALIDRCSYDEIVLTEHQLANAAGHVSAATYQPMFDSLPTKQKDHMEGQWGSAPGIAYVHENSIALAGLEFGNVFMALQPPRGYGMDPDKIYHTPDLPPPHNYYALYRWLRDEWQADAIVHMGKHGTLEWLPGKGVGLSSDCYPDSFLDDMPLIYPFIINDPGEGTQAKRRAHAIIIDHLTPPMTTADGYGELAQLMQLVDEYYQIEMLDPSKLPLIQKQIWELIQVINLDEDMAFILNHDHDHDHGDDSHDKDVDVDDDNDGGHNDEHDHSHSHHENEAKSTEDQKNKSTEDNHDHSHSHHEKGEDVKDDNHAHAYSHQDEDSKDDNHHAHAHSHHEKAVQDLGQDEKIKEDHDHAHSHAHHKDEVEVEQEKKTKASHDHAHSHSHKETEKEGEQEKKAKASHDHAHSHSHKETEKEVEQEKKAKAGHDHAHSHSHKETEKEVEQKKKAKAGHDHAHSHSHMEKEEEVEQKKKAKAGHDHSHAHSHHEQEAESKAQKNKAAEDNHDHFHSHHQKEAECLDQEKKSTEDNHDHSHLHSQHQKDDDSSEGSHHSHSHSHPHRKKETEDNHDHSHLHSHHEKDDDSVEGSHDHSHAHGQSADKDAHAHDDDQIQGLDKSDLAKMDGKDFAHLIEDMDGYLCELAGAQIRDGLHILGQVPQGDTMVDMLQALTRLPNLDVPSLREAIAAMFGLDSPALLSNQGARLHDVPPMLTRLAGRPLATAGDAVETIDELVKHILALLDQSHFDAETIPHAIGQTFPGLSESAETSDINAVLSFVCETLVPSLKGTTAEITNLINALSGEFVPAGPSGSPTRGMAHLLPTGRNFYAVDPQALPSFAAWEVGQGLAKEVCARFLKETGAYPEHVAISVWGTAAMRTHGDDIAQIFALLGVRPTWQRENHRVTGVELIPLSELGRPRIDVTVRISGFFRDAFPHLITLLDEGVQLAINADEPIEENFIRKHFLEDMDNEEIEEASARYRIFGCPPGAYGIGILDLIEAQNWQDESDFAKCYINWGGYAYSSDEPEGVDARTEFTHRLTTVEVAIHNQDDREHDIFDSDDYFQFHGGMIATIRALSGKQPKGYFGDTQNPAVPKVRDIKEETLRVYRTRVINPKWLESIARHGYKGASEMAATVDYLFGFDATADVVSDFMYEQVAQSYALSKTTQEFFERSNPWALRGISERLLEAAQRGMWAEPNPETLEALRQTLLDTDSMLEGRSEPPLWDQV